MALILRENQSWSIRPLSNSNDVLFDFGLIDAIRPARQSTKRGSIPYKSEAIRFRV